MKLEPSNLDEEACQRWHTRNLVIAVIFLAVAALVLFLKRGGALAAWW